MSRLQTHSVKPSCTPLSDDYPSHDHRYLRIKAEEKLISCSLSPKREILLFPSSASVLTGAQEPDRPRDGGDEPEIDNGPPVSQGNNS